MNFAWMNVLRSAYDCCNSVRPRCDALSQDPIPELLSADKSRLSRNIL